MSRDGFEPIPYDGDQAYERFRDQNPDWTPAITPQDEVRAEKEAVMAIHNEAMVQATEIVHWPGQSVPACDAHANKLRGLAHVLGFPLASTPPTEEIECSNCANEAKKKQ